MRRTLGVLTEDFRLYHDLVTALKARDLPFESLSFHQRIPEHIGVVITSPAEFPRVKFRRKIALEDIDDAIAQAQRLLQGKEEYDEVVVGVDPGPRPGVAVVGDGAVVEERTAESPEAVAKIVGAILRNHPSLRRVTVRVGHGDRTNRNRIINALADQEVQVEIADEGGTTPEQRRDDRRNIEAAREIAFIPGTKALRWYRLSPTEGEVKEVQRLSRIDSEGEITISRELAQKVAEGKLTMAEAIRRQRRTKPPDG